MNDVVKRLTERIDRMTPAQASQLPWPERSRPCGWEATLEGYAAMVALLERAEGRKGRREVMR